MTDGSGAQGWFPDPSRRHEYRFWDGRGWTSLVSDRGVQSYDTPGEAAAPAQPAPAGPTPQPGPGYGARPPGTGASPAGSWVAAGGMRPGAGQPMPPSGMAGGGPGQGWAPVGGPPGGQELPGQHKRRKWALPVVLVCVLALLVGLLVWRPWVSRPPNAPTALASKALDGQRIELTWSPGEGGPEAEKYLILRNGSEVGSVAGGTLTYTDSKDLSPADTYTYTIVAVADGNQSPASAAAEAQTAAPAPRSVEAGDRTADTIELNWSKPKGADAPDSYLIYRDGEMIDSVKGTSFVDSDLAPATRYEYTVAGVWGDRKSKKTSTIKVRTVTPPVSAGRVAGEWTTRLKMISSGGGDWPKPGKSWTEMWVFKPKCKSGACSVVVTADVVPEGYRPEPFKITLTRKGGTYSGTTRTHVTNCRSKELKNTVTIQLKVKESGVLQREWFAGAATGSVVIRSPYTTAGGGYYCPAQTVRTALAAKPAS